MSMYSNQEMIEVGEELGKFLQKTKYPETYFWIGITSIIGISGSIFYYLI